MCPESNGYGDYIIMEIDKDGKIDKWDSLLVREIGCEQ